MHRKGHEIGVFSVTRRDEAKYWSEGSYDDWLAEMAGARDGRQTDWSSSLLFV